MGRVSSDYEFGTQCWSYLRESVQQLPGAAPIPHTVNLVVAAWRCYVCNKQPADYDCEHCGVVKEKIFQWSSPDDPPDKVRCANQK